MFGHNLNVSPKGIKLKTTDLKNRTQQSALVLLKKEEINEKKKRLEALLIPQFIGKYGSKKKSSEINGFIQKSVKDFLSDDQNVSNAESLIDSLESQIKVIVEKMKSKMISARQEQMQAAEGKQKSDSQSTYRSGTYKSTSEPATQRRDTPPDENNRWPMLTAIQTAVEEQKTEKEIQDAINRKKKYQMELSKQLMDQQRRAAQAEEEKRKSVEKLRKDTENYEYEKILEQEKKENHFRFEREIRMKQIEERKIIREKERLMKIEQEQDEMARTRQLAREEQERLQQKKDEQKRAQDQLYIENENNKYLKATMLRKQQEQERAVAKEYELKLAREEVARANAFKARMDALANIAKNYESRVGNRLQEAKEQMDIKEKNSRDEHERMLVEKERLKQERRKQDIQQAQEFNLTLMEKKRKEKEDERLDAIARRLQMERDAMEVKQKEKELAEKKRLQMIDQKRTLDQQVQHRKNQVENVTVLSEMEVTLNRSILTQLTQDPVLKQKVYRKLHPEPFQMAKSQIF